MDGSHQTRLVLTHGWVNAKCSPSVWEGGAHHPVKHSDALSQPVAPLPLVARAVLPGAENPHRGAECTPLRRVKP